MKYKEQDIVLVKYPFTDLQNIKLRPALILRVYKDDIIVFPITTKKTGYHYNISDEDLIDWKLLTQSYLKISSIFTLNEDLIVMKIATLSEQTFYKIIKKFIENILNFKNKKWI